MKLVYSQNRNKGTEAIHRFEVLGEITPDDLDILQTSIFHFIGKLDRKPQSSPVMIIDFSDSSLRMNEPRFQEIIAEIRHLAIANGITISIPQSDIESIHAENKAVEHALMNKIDLLENRLNLMESVRTSILAVEKENEELREKIKKSESKKGARGIFEKLWSET